MTTSAVTLPHSDPLPAVLKKKRVLLVDASTAKRDLRAEALRNLGMEVDTASDIAEARSWWRADLYNLVLINTENDMGHRDRFCEDVRAATPPQQLAFLVGKPDYLAGVPNEGVEPEHRNGGPSQEELRAVLPIDLSVSPTQRWGIMEASRRISAVRSVFAARSTALRNRPTPPRDMEIRYSKRAEAEAQFDQLQRPQTASRVEDHFQEVQKEEMQ
jgi:hypothetical protein